jgi:dTDP-4-dehydrorhamnose reductase
VQKTVLITGCSGQLGLRLHQELSKHFNVIPSYKNSKDIKNRLDITSSVDCNYILSNYKVDIIINCAALTDVDFCEKDKKFCRDINVAGLKRLIASSNINTKIIHISSDYVFDGALGNYTENCLTYPVNYYGKSNSFLYNFLMPHQKHNQMIYELF